MHHPTSAKIHSVSFMCLAMIIKTHHSFGVIQMYLSLILYCTCWKAGNFRTLHVYLFKFFYHSVCIHEWGSAFVAIAVIQALNLMGKSHDDNVMKWVQNLASFIL